MSKKSTKHTYVSKTNWTKLAQADDQDINYEDILATDADFWIAAKVFIPTSIRLDEAVIDYFKNQGKGYQSKINAVLRAYVIAQQH